MHRNLKGFTLIELLMVVAIISLLSTVVLTSLSVARARAQETAIRSQGDEIAKMIAQCDLNGGKILAPNSATAPTNNFCSLGASYGKWPSPTQGWQWYTDVWTANLENLMYGSMQAPGPNVTYINMYCGVYPAWESNCENETLQGMCQTAKTYTCTFYNQYNGYWE